MWALPEKYIMYLRVLSIYFLPSPFVPQRKGKHAWEKLPTSMLLVSETKVHPGIRSAHFLLAFLQLRDCCQ